jgi:hypothetical protein
MRPTSAERRTSCLISPKDLRELPANPDLRHLKGQAKDLVKAGQAPTLAKRTAARVSNPL